MRYLYPWKHWLEKGGIFFNTLFFFSEFPAELHAFPHTFPCIMHADKNLQKLGTHTSTYTHTHRGGVGPEFNCVLMSAPPHTQPASQ